MHCQAGVSRSPTIVIAYLMRQFGISTNEAFNKVREMRPIVAPNIVFMSQLMDYESRLKATYLTAHLSTRLTTTRLNNCVAETNTELHHVVQNGRPNSSMMMSIDDEIIATTAATGADKTGTDKTAETKSPIECN